MTTRRRIALALIVIITIALDQTAKALARRTLMNSYPVKVGILTLLHTENAGAFLSLGADLSPNVRHVIFDGLVSIGLLAAAFVLFTGRLQPPTDDVAIAFI